ncbi:MAG: amino acid adenylation domain-containing protein [Acidobacteriota bacterium]
MAGDSLKTARESSTVVDLLRWRALQSPDQAIYTFLPDGETEAAHLTLAGLDHRARAIAALLQREGLEGACALLLFPPGLDFISAFFGCLYANVIAIPTPPPHSIRALPGLKAVIQDAQPRVILTASTLLPRVERWLKGMLDDREVRLIATDELASDFASQWQMPSIESDTLAFLQYTSGSTAAPKGVMVSHGNLLHNERLIQTAFRQTEKSVVVGWLPLYHDMGLIGNVLQPLFAGGRCILMPPLAFLQQPLRWLQCITRYQATTSGGPNFAYELCVRKIAAEQRRGLELGSWEVAFNGAEPVRAETMERFAAAFAPCGFRRAAFFPCYGLAEATLLVSGGHLAGDQGLVSCGKVFDGARVAVVNPQSLQPCEPEQVGELWVSGHSVATGYWRRPEETGHVFRAHLAGRGPFLRTGDLGFLRDSELFITGRLKELIIIRGRNYYPQDIELTVENCHPALPASGGGVFSADIEGEERVILVQELARSGEDDVAKVAMAARRAVAEEHGLHLYEVVFIRAGTLPKTTSGKIQRNACRDLYLSGGLRVFARDVIADASGGWNVASLSREDLMNAAPENRPALVENYLRELISRVLRVSSARLDCDQGLIALGLDSLMATELKHCLEEELGVTLSFSELLGGSLATAAQQILRQLENGEAQPVSIKLSPTSDTSDFPLTHGQKALWFLHRLAPESSAYNLAAAVRIRSALNIAALRSAFDHLVARHPSLRTVFTVHNGAPVPLIRQQVEIAFAVADAARWNQALLEERLAEEAHSSFDLEQGPLVRFSLFARGDEEHIAILVLHHIIADFRSLEVLFEELSILYRDYERERGAHLAPLVAEYADYARWQERMIAGPEGARHWDFWQRQLSGELPELNLTTDRPRPAVQTYRGTSVNITLSHAITEQVKAIGQAYGATVYTTLLAAFYVLLHRYTGQEDVLVGSPTDGRSAAEFANLVGYFVNPVALRADLSGNPAFVELLARVRQLVLEAFEHRDYPFALLVERLQPARDASRAPLFQAMFVFQQSARQETKELAAFALGSGGRLKLGGLDVESLPIKQRAAQFEVTLLAAETDAGISAALQYNTDLFNADTAARLLNHYANLLASIVAAPEQSIASLPLLSQQEQHQLTVEWNDTRRDYPDGELLHELFEAQVERTPEAVALVYGREWLTYRDLNMRANQLAQRLRAMGVGPETGVGVFSERTPEMLIGLLAILKAGGAYVALDPSHPAERIAFMLQDARMPVLLTQKSLRERLPAQHKTVAKVLCLDAELTPPAAAKVNNPPRTATDKNLAYIIYTSGSTGRPKGVSIEHRSATTLLRWAGEAFTRDELSGVLASTSICFDLSVFELFVPLSYGGKVILAENALELPSLPSAHEVTLINTVPSAIAELTRGGRLPASVQTVNLAGEALSRALVEQVYQNLAVRRVFNLYGPSEDTTYSTCALIARDCNRPPPIGRPVANTQVYLLDPHFQPVPIGVPGELYLGGAGLARGYLNQPELTAERFIPDPFGGEMGARLYRTGDLARYLPDGELEFLGRIDQQIKLRGFRIELGEIETVLRQHAAVKEAVVLARANAAGEQGLAAYAVFKPGQHPTPDELRRYVQGKLPGYMIPTAFVLLDAFPLTPNGKIDRRALPSPVWRGSDAVANGSAPRTQIEEALAGIWADVLGLERVGIDDNFFELGGHSLQAARLASRVRAAFGVDLPLRSVFEAPTVAGLASHITALLRAGSPAPEKEMLRHVSRDQVLPLSFGQQHFWLLEQLGARVAGYNMPIALRWTGPLNVAALEQGFQEIVRRHESLRTNFPAPDGQPVQIIAAPAPVCSQLCDLGELPEADRQAVAERLAVEEGQAVFDLANERLFRLKLLKLGADDHLVLLTLHHIIADEQSLRILLDELAVLYESFGADRPSPLPELPVQYADYAVWQQKCLAGDWQDKLLSYWRQQLGNEPATLNLPVDRPRPPVQSFRGATVSLAFPEESLTKLQALSRSQGATLFMTLLAAFKVLLHRYTGQRDIVVGTPVSTRSHPDLENLIGCFVNTLALRSEVAGELTFAHLLARVREVALSGFAHQELPFELLVKEVQPHRDPSRNSLFQVMFAFQGEALPIGLPGVNLDVLNLDYGVAKCDLTLVIEVQERGFVASLEYSTDLFERSTAARLLDHYAHLLEGIAAQPEQRLSALPLLSEAECRQQLADWNATRGDYPHDKTIHELFEAQAARTPAAMAIAAGDQRLTYRELDERANQLAHRLRRGGVKRGALIGVLAERSAEAVVALLGVLKAGAAYLPLATTDPAARLRLILAEAGVNTVVSEERLAGLLIESGLRVVCLDGGGLEELERESRQRVLSGACAEDLAYVIYTSGSTGRPKGVMVQHSALANHGFAVGRFYDLQPPDRVLQFAALSFDVAAEELFPSLLHGCSVFIRPSQAAPTLPELLRYVTEESLTVLNLPTPYWHEWVSDLASAAVLPPPTLRLLIAGSDRAAPERLALWQQIVGSRVRWLNAYGTTETTITSTIHEPPVGRTDLNAASVSIGRPIANTQAYLLDDDLNLLPVGAHGELFIGGDGLACGYLNDPGLTAERFLPHPFSSEPGARLYRTGDLARYLPGGELEFLGRRDGQVKIRGFRIETGEIEAALRRHPQVRQAVVVAQANVAGEQRLVAYVIPWQAPAPVAGEFRKFLAEKLPEYMIPAVFALLDELPLTPSGKLDRRALTVRPVQQAQEEGVEPPRSATEEVIAGIWAKTLGVEQVGLNDSFFELGGHSLLAVRIVSRVGEVFQVEIHLTGLFESPTVAGLARTVEAALRAGRGITTAPVRRVVTNEPPPLSSSQQRLWFLDQLKPGDSAYNLAGAIRLRGRLDAEALQKSLNDIIRRHDALRTTFATIDGRPIQVIAPAMILALPLIDLSGLPEAEREKRIRQLLTQEAQRAFDLQRGPLLRAVLAREDEESHVLGLTLHHTIADAWSLAILTEEIATLYEASISGQTAALAELPIQYADYAVWQQEWLQTEAAAAQRAYWRRQLSGAPTTLQLPTDRPRPALPSHRGATQSFLLPAELCEALKSLSRSEGVTLFMTLLAAFQTQFVRYSGQEDVVTGTDVAGRNLVETERLIGFFVNTLVLRTDLSGDPTFRELLARVRKVAIDAYSNQDLPFDEVVSELQPERDPGMNPLFQVMFIMQNAPQPNLSLPGLSLTPLPIEDGTTAFDLSVALEEDERSGLGGTFRYSTDLFDPATVARMIGHFGNLLRAIVAQPDARLSALEMFGVDEAESGRVEAQQQPSRNFARLTAIKPRVVSLRQRELVKSGQLLPDSPLPLVLQPAIDDVDLTAWAAHNREFIAEKLHRHGAILFRNFDAGSLARFEEFAKVTSHRLMAYGERSSPRTALGGYVYTSTDHPSDQHILLHNEQSYTLEWPMKLWFCCRQPAARGGSTPIAGSRNIARRLADVAPIFERRRVMYVRNYGQGLGLSWQEVFQTSDREAVEAHCQQASIEVEWLDDNRLRTRQVRPALRKHPVTGQTVWFNHALFFHVSSLEQNTRDAILAGTNEEDLPYNTYYGDGGSIEPEVLDRIREAYRHETVSFAWQRGDILLVDNMLVAHGREAFEGEREVAVVMGDPYGDAYGDQ